MNQKSLETFADKVLEAMPLIARGMLRKQADVLTRGEVTIPQYATLDLIEKNGQLKMHEIASELNISLPAATGLVSRLVKMGFVKRCYDQTDRRIINIELTKEGKQVVSQISQKRKEMVTELFGKLSEPERKKYLEILQKLAGFIKNEK